MPQTVILADDEAHITCVVGSKLRSAGYVVHSARDGEEALELVRRLRPALVITDLQMPRMSGLELAKRLKEDAATSSIPVVMLTARGYIAEPAALARTNIVRLMSKPFSAREVLRLVIELTAGRGAGGGGESREAA